MVVLTTTQTERVLFFCGRVVVIKRRWTVNSDTAEGVVLAIPRREKGVVAKIRNDRVALSFHTGLLRRQKELKTEVCWLYSRGANYYLYYLG